MKKILFITNGHGEDIVTSQIIKYLKRKDLKIEVLPVVGKGEVFNSSEVTIIGPKKVLPGGGFGLRNYSYLIKDIFSGLLTKIADQIRTLRKNRYTYNLVIGIGDIVPIIYSMMTQCPFILVGVNKSEHYKKLAFNYTSFEKWLLKKYCKLTLARDKKTADSLNSYGINAKYVGNPMMDMGWEIGRLGDQGIRRGKNKTKIIGFLPGTREDAYKNIEDFNKIAEQIRQLDKKIHFILSFPDTLDRKKLRKIQLSSHIQVIGDFNKILRSSDIIIGLSGTGNEQAAGCGIPVISFPGRGAQYYSRFAFAQKELLGNALLLLRRDSKLIAHHAVSLLYNKSQMKRMAMAGKERMGKPGASKKIADIILKEIRL